MTNETNETNETIPADGDELPLAPAEETEPPLDDDGTDPPNEGDDA